MSLRPGSPIVDIRRARANRYGSLSPFESTMSGIAFTWAYRAAHEAVQVERLRAGKTVAPSCPSGEDFAAAAGVINALRRLGWRSGAEIIEAVR